MKTKNENDLIEQIEELKDLISEKEAELDGFELDPCDWEEQYRDMLDDCYPEVFNILPSRILEECDPIAYRCGLNDYIDGLDVADDEKYQEIENELEDLKNQLEELEEELENL